MPRRSGPAVVTVEHALAGRNVSEGAVEVGGRIGRLQRVAIEPAIAGIALHLGLGGTDTRGRGRRNRLRWLVFRLGVQDRRGRLTEFLAEFLTRFLS